jgi:MoaA/NifB/PqqE/SkfB family radical SAM enzyme
MKIDSASLPKPEVEDPPSLDWKLWLYTNYDCNLKCSYCVAKSGPRVPRRALGIETIFRLIDEAVALRFTEVFFTGGEPFLLEDIYAMLAYASARVNTTVLTNGMLLRGRRLQQLCEIANPGLVVQVSLDGANPEDHDAYRGQGTWEKTVTGIRLLQQHGFRVRLSTTETPVNSGHLEQLCAFHRSLGIPEGDHLVRPLAKRGFSRSGLEINMKNLIPELTVNVDGVFWHPLSTEEDMLVSRKIFPLSYAMERIQQQFDRITATGEAPSMTFT